jgi:endonuclease/exonuclease/phosphatase family metal-dependent hydrolase
VSATVEVGGRRLGVTSVHLQNRPDRGDNRQRQVEVLLAALAGDPPARIVAGDLNATPGQPEVALLTDAGFESALDAVGDPAALTAPSTGANRRIDWVFGRGLDTVGLRFDAAEVLSEVRTSDHLPILVTLSP